MFERCYKIEETNEKQNNILVSNKKYNTSNHFENGFIEVLHRKEAELISSMCNYYDLKNNLNKHKEHKIFVRFKLLDNKMEVRDYETMFEKYFIQKLDIMSKHIRFDYKNIFVNTLDEWL